MAFKVIKSRRSIFSPFSLKAFICDSADDINNLPRFGILGRQDNDPISVCACAYGSTALVCNGSITETYILTPNNEWIKKTESHSGSGGAIIEPLEVTENGTYTPPEGVDGYSPVSVSVASSGGGTVVTGTVTPTEDTSQIPITHNLGSFPKIAICYFEPQANVIRDETVVRGTQAFAYSKSGSLVGAIYTMGSAITGSLSLGTMATSGVSSYVDHASNSVSGNFSVLLGATKTTATLCTMANSDHIKFSAGKTYRWILISEDVV